MKAKPSSKLAKRHRWNAAMVEERRRLGLSSVNLDWNTAAYLFDQGLSPEEAAPRLRENAT